MVENDDRRGGEEEKSFLGKYFAVPTIIRSFFLYPTSNIKLKKYPGLQRVA